MAGEVFGESFEAVIDHCLTSIGKDYSWGEKPEGFSVDPDFIIGDIANPTHWILVTSSYSPKSFSEKFWRNVAEIFEAKTHYVRPPIVINLVLQSGQMATMQKALAKFVDLEALIDKHDYGRRIASTLNSKISDLQGDRDHKRKCIKDLISDDKQFAASVIEFREVINKLLRKTPSSHEILWGYEKRLRLARDSNVRSSRRTFVRRGLAKLCLLPDDVRLSVIKGLDRPLPISTKVPIWALSVDMFRVQRDRYFLNDPEVLNAIRLLGQERAIETIAKSLHERREMWEKFRGQLTSDYASERERYLKSIYRSKDTSVIMKAFEDLDPAGLRWFFWDLMEILKLTMDGKQKYGFGVLANDVGYKKGISEGYKTLADWANGKTLTSKCEALVDDVSRALQERLKSYPIDTFINTSQKLASEKARNVIEQKAVTYNMFEPLKHIICHALDKAAIQYEACSQPTLLGELIGEPDKIDTPVIRVGNTIIHWKSAHEKGKKHKVKELSGRASAISQRWTGKAFEPRDSIKKKILLLDGTWTIDDLKVLKRSGWDDFYYADEVEEIVRLVGSSVV